MKNIKKYWLKISVLLLAVSVLVPAAAFAETIDIQGATCAGSNGRIQTSPSPNACKNINKDATGTANSIAADVVNILSSVVGVLAVIMIIYAGFRYVSSAGSDEAVKGAKNTILYAVIGLVVVALAQLIVHFVIHTASAPAQSCKHHKVQNGPNKGDKC
jgi:amino acid transporter